MSSSRVTKKQRNIDWMISCNNPTPIVLYNQHAIENYGKTLEQIIGLCEDLDKVSKLENVKKTTNCDSDWNVWLIEKRVACFNHKPSKDSPLIIVTNTEIHRELNSVVSKKGNEKTAKMTIGDPAHSFIINLSHSSKIKGQFNNRQWTELIKRRPGVVRNTYHYEIEPLISNLFSQEMDLLQACKKWHELRNLAAPVYNDGFLYAKMIGIK
ncbi:2098_t:CDS:2 [Rhizophagus irregularis]|nr:2098_t:CDS:2 [Rhizophagus irregularis]